MNSRRKTIASIGANRAIDADAFAQNMVLIIERECDRWCLQMAFDMRWQTSVRKAQDKPAWISGLLVEFSWKGHHLERRLAPSADFLNT
jgi:hypothetical protein